MAQVSIPPCPYPVRAKKRVQEKSQVEAGKERAVWSEAAVVTASVSAKHLASPFLQLKLPLLSPPTHARPELPIGVKRP